MEIFIDLNPSKWREITVLAKLKQQKKNHINSLEGIFTGNQSITINPSVAVSSLPIEGPPL